ncbi:MAG TPA: hypothetical protein PKX15_10835 [Bacteroidales bacterium]|nr:hypothetical protein [Bacteroidales bacterium]
MKKQLIFIFIFFFVLIAKTENVRFNVQYEGNTNETAGFAIYYGPASRQYTNHQIVKNSTNITITNLPSNSSFYLSGRSIRFDGLESDLGNELFITTTPIITNQLPSAVKDFRLSHVYMNIY